MLLFWSKGLAATSVAELCKGMGISLPSMYAAFGSKAALYAEAISHYDQTRGELIMQHFNAAPTAKEAVETLLNCIIHAYTQTKQPLGCMVTLSSVTQAESTALNSLVKEGRALAVDLIRGRFVMAVTAGELSASVDVEVLARTYVTFLQGLSIQARDGVPKEVLLATVKTMMLGWDVLTSPRG